MRAVAERDRPGHPSGTCSRRLHVRYRRHRRPRRWCCWQQRLQPLQLLWSPLDGRVWRWRKSDGAWWSWVESRLRRVFRRRHCRLAVGRRGTDACDERERHWTRGRCRKGAKARVRYCSIRQLQGKEQMRPRCIPSGEALATIAYKWTDVGVCRVTAVTGRVERWRKERKGDGNKRTAPECSAKGKFYAAGSEVYSRLLS